MEINCGKCGKHIDSTDMFCNECGTKVVEDNKSLIVDSNESNINTKTQEDNPTNLIVPIVISAIIGLLFWIRGFYFYLAYESGDYGDSVNAYVGGDAYNYIINGTYFTAFAVIGGVFILGSFILYAAQCLRK